MADISQSKKLDASLDDLNVDKPSHISKTIHRSRRSLLGAVLVILIVIALAFGLGLGLGLKHKNRNAGVTVSASIIQVPRSKLVDPSQFTLSPSFDVNAPAQSREFNWTLSEIISDPAGITKHMLVVNGISPGPTIEANIGDRIIVHVTNNLSNASSIHWHGQNQNGTNFMDGTSGITECGIVPGSTFTYNWTVQNVGTYWWHAHYGTQYTDGLFGALILHSPNDTLKFVDSTTSSIANPNTTYDADLIFFVGDIYNDFSTVVLQSYLSPNGPDGSQGDEPVGDGGLVNGIGRSNCDFTPTGSTCDGGSNYNFTVDAGKRYRMRVINTGSLADVRFEVGGHAMTVVEADATAIQPVVVQSVQVSVAQRYSVIIQTNQQPGAYYVRGEILTNMFNYDNPALVTEQNAIMRYSGTPPTAMPNTTTTTTALDGIPVDLDTNALVPAIPLTPPAATRTEVVFVTFEVTAQSAWGAFFNGTSWAAERGGNATVFQVADAGGGTGGVDGGQFVITNEDIEVFDLIINNQDDGDHPFHLHGHTPWLLGTGDGNYQPGLANNLTQNTNPMRRDTFIIPAYSWGIIRFVTDNPGLWALHCHLIWHMEAGLLMQFSNLPRNIAQFSFPQSMRDQCSAMKGTG